MIRFIKNICLPLVLLAAAQFLNAQNNADLPPVEDDFYKIITVPIPEDVILEVGGLATLPNGSIAASTRHGDIWMIENPYAMEPTKPYFRRFATGMHEVLGLAYRDGSFFAAQRGELTKLTDTDGDGRADKYETVFAWPLSGNYHEYSYGPKIMPDGSMFVTTNVGFFSPEWWRGQSRVPWRGWTMRIQPDGTMEPWATGMRSPCGIGIIDNEFFYGDNQGDWMGSGGLVHVEKGDFTGHPAGLAWTSRPESPVKISQAELYRQVDPRLTPAWSTPIKPENLPDETPKPLFDVQKVLPGIKLPAVWLPHGILGISTSEIVTDDTKGVFGPFSGQVLIGDQGQSKIMRVFLEKVKGEYQGAAFPFREGFQSGVLRMCWGNDGSLFVGQTNRGWGSTGPAPFGLQRLVWTGRMPFEMKAVRAMPDGFEIEFTQPVDKISASNPDNYSVTGFIYKYHPVYGSPIVNQKEHFIQGVVVSEDGTRAHLVVDSLRLKYIYEIKAEGVRAYSNNAALLHNTGFYTLNNLPEGESLRLPARKAKAKKESADASTGEAAPMKMDHSAMKMEAAAAKANAAPPAPATPTAAKKRQLKMPEEWNGKVDQTISLGTLPGLKFDKTLFTLKAGSKVKWNFNNVDDMPHNCVIVQPGEANAVGDLAMNLGLKGPELYYIPKTSKILYHTKLVAPGTAESIYFTTPSKAGDYTFMCTVPGHAQVMRGVIRVVN
ncbi:MAG: plastocyanin/azurin family copper-binding protein [Bacteroidota bacterium]